MPLFKSNANADGSARRNSTDHSTSPTRKKSIFSPNRDSSPPADTSSSNSGFFQRRRSSSESGQANSGKRSGFLGLGRNDDIENDPSIRGAREKVSNAEAAEKQADRALIEARQRVKLAREHVQMLEREAREDARRAKAKQAQAKLVSKSAKGLGRHDN